MKYFVTSDVHSFFNEMQNALHKAGFEESNPDHKLVICGDIFDRGEQSKEMYKYLRDIDNQLILVRGNHEDLLETCYNEIMSGSTPKLHHWSNKTVKTISDLCNIDERDLFRISEETKSKVHSVMLDVLLWIKDKAVDYFTVGDYIFVPGVRKAVLNNDSRIKAYVIKPDGTVNDIELSTGPLTEDERKIIADGCLINYYRET